jgi:hypothetical protein
MRAQPFKGSSPSWCDLRTGRDGVRSLHAYVGDAHTPHCSVRALRALGRVSSVLVNA